MKNFMYMVYRILDPISSEFIVFSYLILDCTDLLMVLLILEDSIEATFSSIVLKNENVPVVLGFFNLWSNQK